MKKAALFAVLAVLVPAGPLFAPTPSAALGAAGSVVTSGDDRCPKQARICWYRLPDHIIAARKACFRAEYEKRGLPADLNEYIRWFEANRGTPEWRDWRAAYKRCQDRNELPGGKWAYEEMIFVRWE